MNTQTIASTSTAQSKASGKSAHEETCTRLEKLLNDNWPYRRSTSTWAGGEHSVFVKLSDKPAGSCTTKQAWSNNGKWSGTNSMASLHITSRCIEELGKDLLIGGLITLDVEIIEPHIYRAMWLEQSRGMSLKMVSGWIIKGQHSTARTLEKAKQEVASHIGCRSSSTGAK